MTEKLVRREHYTEPFEKMAAAGVFKGVYESFSKQAQERNSENPAAEFVKARFDAASRSIEPLVNSTD